MGRGNIDLEDLARILRSPAGKRLERLVRELTDEERIDLVALGWLGEGSFGTEWQPIFGHASKMIDLYAEDRLGDVFVLCVYWRTGFERLTVISV